MAVTPRPVTQAPDADPRPASRPATVAGGKAHWDALTTEAIATGGLTAAQVAYGYDRLADPTVRQPEPLPYAKNVPPNLRTTGETPTSVGLAWDPVAGATNYRLQDNGADVTGATALTTTTYSHTGLTAGSKHHYTVSALVSATRQGESRPVDVQTPSA